MFEFEDANWGQVKVMNVTEARASIATIMQDHDFSYIITKNNKPVRIIVNYTACRSKGPAKPLPVARRLSPPTQRAFGADLTDVPVSAPWPITLEKPDIPAVEGGLHMVGGGPPAEELPADLLPQPPGASSSDPQEVDYFERFRKLYDRNSEKSHVQHENTLETVSLRNRYLGSSETPSIQDLLRELENEKLTGEPP